MGASLSQHLLSQYKVCPMHDVKMPGCPTAIWQPFVSRYMSKIIKFKVQCYDKTGRTVYCVSVCAKHTYNKKYKPLCLVSLKTRQFQAFCSFYFPENTKAVIHRETSSQTSHFIAYLFCHNMIFILNIADHSCSLFSNQVWGEGKSH